MNVTLISQRRLRQRGLSLIELMVALVLGLFLVGVVGLTYIHTASNTRFGALESQMNEDGALALSLLRAQLKLAGYSAPGADGRRLFKGLPLRGCDGGFTAETANKAFDDLACATGNGNDALAVRYQATLFNAQNIAGATPAAPVSPGNCANVAMTTIALNGANVFLADNRFYIAADPSNGGAPTLYCRGSEGVSIGDASALVPNVERLRIRYAITRQPLVDEVPSHQVTALVDATAPELSDVAEWTRVAAVELCIVMRTSRPVPRENVSAADTARYLDCEGNEDTTNTDGFLRRAYRTVVHLPNLRPGLPSPYRLEDGAAVNPYAALKDEQSSAADTGNTTADDKAANP